MEPLQVLPIQVRVPLVVMETEWDHIPKFSRIGASSPDAV